LSFHGLREETWRPPDAAHHCPATNFHFGFSDATALIFRVGAFKLMMAGAVLGVLRSQLPAAGLDRLRSAISTPIRP
jgi:hypothetical protein